MLLASSVTGGVRSIHIRVQYLKKKKTPRPQLSDFRSKEKKKKKEVKMEHEKGASRKA